jgi:hypothetical protein
MRWIAKRTPVGNFRCFPAAPGRNYAGAVVAVAADVLGWVLR